MPIAVWKFREHGDPWKHWNEEEHAAFRERLELQFRVDPGNGNDKKKFRIGPGAYDEALSRLSLERTVYPLREWVNACKASPGSPLCLNNWLTLGFGSPDTPYSEFVQEYFWTSLVRRHS